MTNSSSTDTKYAAKGKKIKFRKCFPLPDYQERLFELIFKRVTLKKTQVTFTCPKSTIETLGKGVKYAQSQK